MSSGIDWCHAQACEGCVGVVSDGIEQEVAVFQCSGEPRGGGGGEAGLPDSVMTFLGDVLQLHLEAIQCSSTDHGE